MKGLAVVVLELCGVVDLYPVICRCGLAIPVESLTGAGVANDVSDSPLGGIVGKHVKNGIAIVFGQIVSICDSVVVKGRQQGLQERHLIVLDTCIIDRSRGRGGCADIRVL